MGVLRLAAVPGCFVDLPDWLRRRHSVFVERALMPPS